MPYARLSDVAKNLMVLHMMDMLKDAWKKVSTQTIQNFWRKREFELPVPPVEDVSAEVPPPLGLIQEEFDHWVDIDQDAKVVVELTE